MKKAWKLNRTLSIRGGKKITSWLTSTLLPAGINLSSNTAFKAVGSKCRRATAWPGSTIFSALLIASWFLHTTLLWAEPTTIPYYEEWIDTQSSMCSPQWVGDCAAGWQAIGEPKTLMVLTSGVDPAYRAIAIKPGASKGNGIRRVFLVNPDKPFQLTASAIAIDGSSEVSVRLAFRNKAKELIETHHTTAKVSDVSLLAVPTKTPALANDVVVDIKARNPSSLDARILLGGCVSPGIEGCASATIDATEGDGPKGGTPVPGFIPPDDGYTPDTFCDPILFMSYAIATCWPCKFSISASGTPDACEYHITCIPCESDGGGGSGGPEDECEDISHPFDDDCPDTIEELF